MPQLQEIIDSIMPELKGMVEIIEDPKRIPTTQNNYGDYYALFPSIIAGYKKNGGQEKDEVIARVFALGLIDAGGNRNGIVSAMSALGYSLH